MRAVPASRRPGFSKGSLARSLGEAGITYRHLRALGTPAPGREAARAGRIDIFEHIFRAHLAGHEAQLALEELAALVREGRRICLLCLEAEPARCHRAIVATELARNLEREGLALEVRHLTPGPG